MKVSGKPGAVHTATAAAAVVQPLAEEIEVIATNIGTVQDAAGPLTDIQTAMLEMAIAFVNSQTRYVSAVAFS